MDNGLAAQPGLQPRQLLAGRYGQEQPACRLRRDLRQHALQDLGLYRQHHHIAGCQHLRIGGAQPQAAALRQRLRLFRMGVVAAEGHALQLRRRDAPHHGGGHIAQSDESDDHMRSLLFTAA